VNHLNLTDKELKVFTRGMDAFERGTPYVCNPYNVKTDEHCLWDMGWFHGKDVKRQQDEKSIENTNT
jgi:hypothetical protein